MNCPVTSWILRGGAVATMTLMASGCVTTVPQHRLPPPPSPLVMPDTTVYAAPARGQTPEQLDRDKYECAQWATQQTGFDPSRPPPPPPPVGMRAVPVGPAPGSGVVTGAATGALVGAAVANPWNPGPSTLVGLVAGAVLGGAVESAQNDRAHAAAAQANAQAAQNAQNLRDGNLAVQAINYRRALSACLDGRGYTVR